MVIFNRCLLRALWGHMQSSISSWYIRVCVCVCVCVHNEVGAVITSIWQRCLAARRHKHSRSAAALTSSSVLCFLSALLNIARFSGKKKKTTTTLSNSISKFFMCQIQLHFPAQLRDHAAVGGKTEPEGSRRDWRISTSQCSISQSAIVP